LRIAIATFLDDDDQGTRTARSICGKYRHFLLSYRTAARLRISLSWLRLGAGQWLLYLRLWLRLGNQWLDFHQFGIAIKMWIEKELDSPGIIDDGEPGLLWLIEPRTAPNDLLELDQRTDGTRQHDVLTGWDIDACAE